MRDTGGKYFATRSEGSGKAPTSRLYGRSHSPSSSSAVCGAWRSGLSSTGHSPDADPVDLAGDGDHRVAEPVEFAQRLALGRLDHQRAGDREAHRRRVESVVHQPLGDVVDRHPGGLGDRTDVDDALVGHPAVGAPIQHREVRVEAFGDVVGRQDGDRGGRRSALCRPSSRCTSTGSAGCRPSRGEPPTPRRPAAVGSSGWPGHERREVGAHADRADARAATAVWDAERLVQVQVAHVGTELARAGRGRRARSGWRRRRTPAHRRRG